MTMSTTYAGMDVHARTISVALLKPGAERPEEWQLEHEPRAVKRLAVARELAGCLWALLHLHAEGRAAA